jgi:dimethylamine/trimethylamine dehydrogenase
MGEEYRRNWHPEVVATRGSDAEVLVVGAGPSGMEAARMLGQRGYRVMLAEAARELGGRVAREAALPGLGEWIRVRDYRQQQIQKMAQVQVFLESELTADDALATGADHVVIATGAHWRADGFGRSHPYPLETLNPASNILTPDDIMAGQLPSGPVVVYDDDSFYMGGLVAEKIRLAGQAVTLVTPEDVVSDWCDYTSERFYVQKRLLELGVTLQTSHQLVSYHGQEVRIASGYTDQEQTLSANALVLVTARQPNDALYQTLKERLQQDSPAGAPTLHRIGDCDAPAIIAAAVYAGHRFARELDTDTDNRQQPRYE